MSHVVHKRRRISRAVVMHWEHVVKVYLSPYTSICLSNSVLTEWWLSADWTETGGKAFIGQRLKLQYPYWHRVCRVFPSLLSCFTSLLSKDGTENCCHLMWACMLIVAFPTEDKSQMLVHFLSSVKGLLENRETTNIVFRAADRFFWKLEAETKCSSGWGVCPVRFRKDLSWMRARTVIHLVYWLLGMVRQSSKSVVRL